MDSIYERASELAKEMDGRYKVDYVAEFIYEWEELQKLLKPPKKINRHWLWKAEVIL